MPGYSPVFTSLPSNEESSIFMVLTQLAPIVQSTQTHQHKASLLISLQHIRLPLSDASQIKTLADILSLLSLLLGSRV